MHNLGARLKKLGDQAALYTVLSILLGFAVGALALLIAGYNPAASYARLFGVIFGSTKNMSYSFIEYATPYILTGLSVAFSFKTGIFNIGAEGQYVIGSVAALLAGYYLPAPAVLHIPLCLLAALLAGGAWGALVAWLRVKYGANEILCMIMFNWIAYYLSNYVANLKGLNVGSGKTWTHNIADSAKITISHWSPALSGKAHFGIFIALIAVAAVYYLINRTTLGFRLQAVGSNPHAAQYAGINTNRSMLVSLFISGALAACAGAVQVMGVTYKVTQFAGQEGYGFQGITVALIGATNPIGVLFGGLFFGALRFGGTRFDAPSEIVDIIMGCIVFFIAISNLVRHLVSARTKRGAR